MAGIVASTLRRKAFHKKATTDNRYQVVETHISQSPESHGSPTSPTGFKARTCGTQRAPKGAKLCFEDFWPTCVNPTETNLSRVEFETFDTLVPKANTWLENHQDIHLIKCETLEKKVTSVEDVTSDSSMFIPRQGHDAICVKGLRIWYVIVSGVRKMALDCMPPLEVGYMNVIPKCLDTTAKYPVYDNLPETYTAINAYFAESPLEGKIVTIETVALKLPRKQWGSGQEINPDQTVFLDEYLHHMLYITRIYFRYGAPEPELIGAQDFLPDFERSSSWHSIVHGVYPQYSPISSAMRKLKEWIPTARHISITNIQTLEAVYRKHPGTVHTGVNFMEKAESCAMIRFVRVTYVRPVDDDLTGTSHSSTNPSPSGFSYKTVLPAPVKVGMCSGSPIYENISSTCERAKIWLRCVERRIISVETFYHPLNRIWHRQDGCETTVMRGEWTADDRSDRHQRRRRKLVHVMRVFMDGDYMEPPPHLLPPAPMVEEINDCRCTVM